MKKLILFGFCFQLLFSCNEQQTDNPTTDPKLLTNQKDKSSGLQSFQIETPTNKFVISINKSQVLVTLKNSRITVPANAFIDKLGKEVEGKIELVFKEYQTVGEILASEIPMVYTNPNGEKENFESAGMFEIRAFQGKEELRLKPNKTIKVELSSSDNGQYNFYQLNDQHQNWSINKENCLPVPNDYRQSMQNELDEMDNAVLDEPKKPIDYNPNQPVFDINQDFNNNQELKDFNGVMWQPTEGDINKSKQMYEKVVSKQIEFFKMEPADNENLEFVLKFISTTDTILFKAAPILKGRLLSQQKDKNEKLIKGLIASAKKHKNITDQIKRESELLRTFDVAELGIYNYDRQFKDPNAIMIDALLAFEGISEPQDLEFVSIYLIPSSKRVVIKYTEETFHSLAINPKENNKLVAVLPDNTVFYFSNKDFHELNLFDKKKVKIQMNKYEKVVNDVKVLDDLISSL